MKIIFFYLFLGLFFLNFKNIFVDYVPTAGNFSEFKECNSDHGSYFFESSVRIPILPALKLPSEREF